MTENNFNKKSKEGMPLGAYVLGLAYQIIPDFDAAREIRDEVMAIGLKRCTEFEVKTAWEGSESWPGLKKITRTCCERMMLRPMRENPLAKERLKQCGDPWAAAIGKLSFRHRQIFLLQMAFGGNSRAIHGLLNKHRAEDEKKLTQKEVKNLQAETVALMVAHLPAPYTMSD
ncbi:hypothetical protein F4054_00095 [Candidatus Poribacteria bacterium]|nr:hypothetical protein [Candidatus Poribacteria bacterium]MYK20646.1 hypothetical protein [Candidatus Poribacteria bacterium]